MVGPEKFLGQSVANKFWKKSDHSFDHLYHGKLQDSPRVLLLQSLADLDIVSAE